MNLAFAGCLGTLRRQTSRTSNPQINRQAGTPVPYQGVAWLRDFVYAFTKTYCGVSTRCQCLRAMEVLNPERSR